MKKILVLLFLLQAFNVKAYENTCFTGIFCGLGMITSFDEDYLTGQAIRENGEAIGSKNVNKKSSTTYGGQVILGYGYQFENNLYFALTHELNFLSNRKHRIENGQSWFQISKKIWTPSFGFSAGYVFDDINLGIRSGISFNKYKYEQYISAMMSDKNVSKTLTETSPYVGLYVEKKFGCLAGYINIDHVFQKQKLAHDTKFGNNMTNRSEHKHRFWKTSIGIKVILN